MSAEGAGVQMVRLSPVISSASVHSGKSDGFGGSGAGGAGHRFGI